MTNDAPLWLGILTNEQEPVQVRVHVLKRLRDARLTDGLRARVANAILRLLRDPDRCPTRLRLHAALALAEFTDVHGVAAGLGAVTRDPDVTLDIRYSAFTALERTGPTPESVALMRQLVSDDALGASARTLLASWQIGNLE